VQQHIIGAQSSSKRGKGGFLSKKRGFPRGIGAKCRAKIALLEARKGEWPGKDGKSPKFSIKKRAPKQG
jgi:hypothetical protein